MSKLLISGLISLLAGAVLMILGQMWALALFLVGFGLIVAGWAQMFRGAGYREVGGPLNGLNGQGRQQSEVVKGPKAPQGYEDKPSNIWEQTESK